MISGTAPRSALTTDRASDDLSPSVCDRFPEAQPASGISLDDPELNFATEDSGRPLNSVSVLIGRSAPQQKSVPNYASRRKPVLKRHLACRHGRRQCTAVWARIGAWTVLICATA
jgi:hypothetical protein